MNNLSESIDASHIFGIDALSKVLQSTWKQIQGIFTEYGPNFLFCFILIVVYSLLFWGLSFIARQIVQRIISAENQNIVHATLKIIFRLSFFMLILVSCTALFPPLAQYGLPIFRGYLLLLFLYLGWGGVQRVIHLQIRKRDLDSSLELLLNNTALAFWVLIGIYLVFQQFSINLLPIIGGLGVAGLAIGLAAQDILANLISGITLLLDRPFRIGDWIRVADHEGQVKGLTLRTTRIRTRENEYVNIPNKEVAGAVVVNLTQGGPLRLDVPVSIAYHENVDLARTVLLGALHAHPQVLKEPVPIILVKELAASGVDLIIRFWISEYEIASYPATAMKIRESAKIALQNAEIEIPFPHLQLHIDGAKGLAQTSEKILKPHQ